MPNDDREGPAGTALQIERRPPLPLGEAGHSLTFILSVSFPTGH